MLRPVASNWVVRGSLSGVVALSLAVACGDSNDGNDPRGAAGSDRGGSAGATSGAMTSGGAAAGKNGASSAGASGSSAGLSSAAAGTSNGGTSAGTSPIPDGGAAVEGGASASGGAHAGGVGGDAGGTSGDGGDGNVGGAPSCSDPVNEPPFAGCGVYGTVTTDSDMEEENGTLSVSTKVVANVLGPARLDQVELHYYLSLEETSGLAVHIDSFVLQPGNIDVTASSETAIIELSPHRIASAGPGCHTHFVSIRNSSALELGKNGSPYAEVHFTLEPNDPSPPNQVFTNDQSHNYGLSAYVCGMLVSGCTPGDGGACD